MANAESTSARGITEVAKSSGAVTPTINSASENNVTDNGLSVKQKYSLEATQDTAQDGQTTETQQTQTQNPEDIYTRQDMVAAVEGMRDTIASITGTKWNNNSNDIITQLKKNWKQNGRVDQETLDEMFGKVWDRAKKSKNGLRCTGTARRGGHTGIQQRRMAGAILLLYHVEFFDS
ncbi:MAG: hypothetical protein HUJ67_04435 [Ruminiclostridium sp.]|nr:hypothetical protein [Ruminiclostridium sp.]